MRTVLISLALVSALVAGCQSAPPTPAGTPSPAATVAAATPAPAAAQEKKPPQDVVKEEQWTEFTASDGSFTVLLPGEADTDLTTQDTEDGEVRFGSLLTEVGDDLYSLQYIDYPTVELAQRGHEERLAAARDSASGQLKSEQTVTLDGHDGVLFELETSGGDTFYDAIFLVDRRVYDILIEHNQDPGADSSFADRVRESFRFNS